MIRMYALHQVNPITIKGSHVSKSIDASSS
jgi:hypothetical protein